MGSYEKDMLNDYLVRAQANLKWVIGECEGAIDELMLESFLNIAEIRVKGIDALSWLL